jgi:hypothetical protein
MYQANTFFDDLSTPYFSIAITTLTQEIECYQ